MASEPILTAFDLPLGKRSRFWDSKTWVDYFALTKPEVNFLIAVTTFVGFYLGHPAACHDFPFLRSINAVLGTLLVASGTGALNQYVERRFDAQMRRTSRRPLAAGRLKPSAVLWFGIALSVLGTVYLVAAINLLASLLALGTLLSYLFFYTPLKRKSPLCTLVGAFPGAMPPLIGWAAASGRLALGAWTLYSMLFLWQFPHFMSIAWMYREDYDRAGYLVLPKGQSRVPFVVLQTLVPLAALVAVSIMQAPARHGAIFYFADVLLGGGFLYSGVKFVIQRSRAAARRLLTASIVYLPLLFGLSVALCNQAAR